MECTCWLHFCALILTRSSCRFGPGNPVRNSEQKGRDGCNTNTSWLAGSVSFHFPRILCHLLSLSKLQELLTLSSLRGAFTGQAMAIRCMGGTSCSTLPSKHWHAGACPGCGGHCEVQLFQSKWESEPKLPQRAWEVVLTGMRLASPIILSNRLGSKPLKISREDSLKGQTGSGSFTGWRYSCWLNSSIWKETAGKAWLVDLTPRMKCTWSDLSSWNTIVTFRATFWGHKMGCWRKAVGHITRDAPHTSHVMLRKRCCSTEVPCPHLHNGIHNRACLSGQVQGPAAWYGLSNPGPISERTLVM